MDPIKLINDDINSRLQNSLRRKGRTTEQVGEQVVKNFFANYAKGFARILDSAAAEAQAPRELDAERHRCPAARTNGTA